MSFGVIKLVKVFFYSRKWGYITVQFAVLINNWNYAHVAWKYTPLTKYSRTNIFLHMFNKKNKLGVWTSGEYLHRFTCGYRDESNDWNNFLPPSVTKHTYSKTITFPPCDATVSNPNCGKLKLTKEKKLFNLLGAGANFGSLCSIVYPPTFLHI